MVITRSTRHQTLERSARSQPLDVPVEPWSEEEVLCDLLVAARAQPRRRIRDAELRRGPGTYLLFYTGPHPLYAPLADGRWPIYAGRARSLRARLTLHREALDAVKDLDARDFVVLGLPSSSEDAAIYMETLLIRACEPVWNASCAAGVGHRPQGANRTGQRRSSWDTLHPGRTWARRMPTQDRAQLAGEVARYLADEGIPLGFWPRLR